MVNSDIANLLPNSVTIYADSSEPKSIEEIRRFGKMIKGVTKGSYWWDVAKDGTRRNVPIDHYNHAIDALRYHEMETLGLKKNYGQYNIR